MSAEIIAFPIRPTEGAQRAKGPFVDERGRIVFRVTSAVVQAACERWQHLILSGWIARMKPRDIDIFHNDQLYALGVEGRAEYLSYVEFVEQSLAAVRKRDLATPPEGSTPRSRGGRPGGGKSRRSALRNAG